MGKSTIPMAMFNSYFDIRRVSSWIFPKILPAQLRGHFQIFHFKLHAHLGCQCLGADSDALIKNPHGGFGTGRRKGKVGESYVESMETYGKNYGNIWENIWEKYGKNMGKLWFFYPIVSDAHFCSE
jgi:hypothetical protein